MNPFPASALLPPQIRSPARQRGATSSSSGTTTGTVPIRALTSPAARRAPKRRRGDNAPAVLGPRAHSVDEIFEAAKQHFIYEARLAGVACFEACPITTKDVLYAGIEAARAARHPLLQSTYWSPSGGSTSNKSFYFPSDIRENELMRDLLAAQLIQARFFGPENVCLNLNAGTHMYRAMELFTDFGQRAGATMLPAGNNISDAEAIELARTFHANTLIGPPTRLEQLCQVVLDAGRTLDVPVIITACDKLHVSTRAVLQRATGAQVFMQLFGSSESGVWAYQPAALQGTSSFFFDPAMMHVEIVDPDETGQGRIVLTNLVRLKHPLLRYDTGDMGRVEVRTVEGEERHVLEFCGRNSRSFTYDADSYELADVEAALANRASRYQIHVSFDPRTHAERVDFLVVAPDATAGLEHQLKRDLRCVCPVTTLQIVRMDQLQKNRRSAKMPLLVDHRDSAR